MTEKEPWEVRPNKGKVLEKKKSKKKNEGERERVAVHT